MNCFFVTDLHGKIDRYDKLIDKIKEILPDIVFIGGDILSNFNPYLTDEYDDFILDYLIPLFQNLKSNITKKYPKIFIILGNDDPKIEENKILKGQECGLWEYIHNRKVIFNNYIFYGYANIPPTPFLLKDWEDMMYQDM